MQDRYCTKSILSGHMEFITSVENTLCLYSDLRISYFIHTNICVNLVKHDHMKSFKEKIYGPSALVFLTI